MLVSRQDDRRALVDQSIERVEKLILGGPLCRQEVDVIDDQSTGTSITSAKAAQAAGSHRIQEAVGKRLGGELSDIQVGVRLPEGMGDAFQQVCLAQSDGTVNHQRVEGSAGRLSHLCRCGMSKPVARPRDEVLKPPRWRLDDPDKDESPAWVTLPACVLAVEADPSGGAGMVQVGPVSVRETKGALWGCRVVGS